MMFWSSLDDRTGVCHKYAVLKMEKERFLRLKKLFETEIPDVSSSATIRKGCPSISVSISLGTLEGGFRLAIPLNWSFESGGELGDKLAAGDILVVILTDQSSDRVISSSKDGLSLNVPVEDVCVFSLRYTEEMSEIYSFSTTLGSYNSGSTGAKRKI